MLLQGDKMFQLNRLTRDLAFRVWTHCYSDMRFRRGETSESRTG